MTKDKLNQSPSTPNPPEAGEEFAARRRVIKGITSLPVALTLSNGAAMANASSHQCLTNQPQGVHPVCVRDPLNKDSRWIYSKDLIKPSNGAGQKKYCVAYAREFESNDSYDPTGFLYDDGKGNSVFIDQYGNLVNGGKPYGNPLTVSCAVSFV